jgi:NADH dehydrogenase FAD-containing subunit
MLGGGYAPDDIRFATRHLVEKQGARFVLGKVTHVAPGDRTVHLEDGTTVPYDVLSVNAGSQVPAAIVKGRNADIFSVKPIERLITAQQRIRSLLAEKSTAVGIVGGGPSAAEIAGNIWRLRPKGCPNDLHIAIYAGRQFMAGFPPGVRSKVFESLDRRGIEIHERGYVKEVRSGRITMASGQGHAADVVFLALGVRPSPIFAASGLPVGPDGGLLVNAYLQCVSQPDIFGGGDCIHFRDRPLDKVGVYAVRENPVLCHNLMAALDNRPLQRFDPGGDYLLVFNLGDGTGVLRKSRLLFGGRLAFVVKDAIDRRFMRRFQAYEKSTTLG